MAGHGSRFAEAGFEVPKPLIEVDGFPLYSLAVDSLPLELATRLIFVCLARHLDEWPLGDDIQARYGQFDPKIVALDEVTEGQLCTVLAVSDLFVKGAVMIYNADTVCRTSFAATLRDEPDVDGVIGVFRAPGDHWSFARVDDSGLVRETAEKVRISEWATTGMYHFADAERFVRLATARVARADRSGGEFYVAPLYNDLITEGGRVITDRADPVHPIGTPDELDAYLRLPATQRTGGQAAMATRIE